MGPVPYTDTLIILVLGALVAAAAYYFEKYNIRHPEKRLFARKYLHLIACGSCTISAGLLENLYFLGLIVFFAEILLLWMVLKKDYFSINGVKSMGIVYFPLSFLLLILLFPRHEDRYLIVGPMGFLTLADAMATLVGVKYGRSFFVMTGERKSLIGTAAFMVVGLLWMVVMKWLGFQASSGWGSYLIISAVITGMAAGVEIMGSKGRDNLYVPLISALLLWSFSRSPVPLVASQLAAWSLIFTVGAYLAWKFGLLVPSGAVSAVLMGLGIVCFGNFSLLPILVFFISGSLLGKLPGRVSSDPKDGRPRDVYQVVSNGGIALVLAYINSVAHHPALPLLYLVSVAVSSSDTWSSELGQRLGIRTLDLRTFRAGARGLSGCISLPGVLAGIAGAALIALFAGDWNKALLVFGAGVAGGWLDSFLGAWFQARFQTTTGLSDTGQGKPVSGLLTVSNDVINVSANVLTTGLVALWLFL